MLGYKTMLRRYWDFFVYTLFFVAITMVSACTPVADKQRSKQSSTIDSPRSISTPLSDAVKSEPSPKTSPSVKAPEGAAPSVPMGDTTPLFVARLRRPMAVTSMATSGTVKADNGCLVVSIDNVVISLVLPPGARLKGPEKSPTSIELNGKTIAIGQTAIIPGGGAQLLDSDLIRPIPKNCPSNYFIIGG